MPANPPMNCSCEEASQRIKQALQGRGLRVLETFDLHDARLGLADCTCPHHGTSECDCQMVVMMVYGEGLAPATLILHGSDGQTWISLGDEPARDRGVLIQAAIEKAVKEIPGDKGL